MTTPYEEGSPSARILVLGQAPERAELSMGRPLVGPSGDVFKECLAKAGIARGECYILNVWEDRVRTDKVSGTISCGSEIYWDGSFTAAGKAAAMRTLDRIRNSKANVIIALGQQALELVTGINKAILKWRGSILKSGEAAGGKKVVPTVHPAATIHGVYLWRYLIVSDFQKAKQESLSPELNLPDRAIYVAETVKDIIDYTASCKEEGIVATDIEVINHQVSCYSLARTPHEALVIPLVDRNGDRWEFEDEVAIWKSYADIMHDPDVMKVNQNIIGFDSPFLLQQNHIHIRGPIGDTMVAQHILYPEFNKGLDFIASVHTREPYWKDEGKMWKNPEGGDYDMFWRYNGKDSCVALEAWYVLEEELKETGFWTTYEMTARLHEPLLYMTVHGLAVDRQGLEQTKVKLEAELAALENELHTIAEWPFNPNSPAQCKKYFYETKKLAPYRNSQGGITTDDNAMSRIFRKTGWREAKLVQEIRRLKKLKGTYIEVELDPDHRIRCSWNPRGTWTGRLSSSQTIFGRGMNLQNLDPKFKDFVVAG